jgi:hypothetical protein
VRRALEIVLREKLAIYFDAQLIRVLGYLHAFPGSSRGSGVVVGEQEYRDGREKERF